MMWEIDFNVHGNPQSLKRHKAKKVGNFVQMYDPSESDKKDFLVKAMQHKPDIPFDEPLYVKYTFCFSRPKHHFVGGNKERGLIKGTSPTYHTGTPDLDNLIKFVNDALNGIYWLDDKVICTIGADKVYTSGRYGYTPHIRIQICRINKYQSYERD